MMIMLMIRTMVIKISSHVTSGNDVIGNVTIAKLGFFVALTRFHYRVKNK